jgi:ATP-dependent Lhr-like helicase
METEREHAIGLAMLAATALPPRFQEWFASRGWAPRPHQLAMIEKGRQGRDALLIAPTGGGKTLAGFLPSLIELAERAPRNTPAGVHTLYISPLKALAVDIERNLATPIREMGLKIVAESRTGDTGEARKQRQRLRPPDILLTTPEQLALFCAWEGARNYFADLSCVIIDEAHAIWPSKRGDLLSLGLARLQLFAPNMRRVGLSATVDDPDLVRRWLGWNRPSPPPVGEVLPSPAHTVDLVLGSGGAQPIVEVLVSGGRVPWAGHTAEHAMAEIYEIIKGAKTALVFVNTRFQAEFAFQELWKLNDDGLAIALHHGSLAAEQRRKVEAAMARGEIRAVVCTSTLDMGIDWGDVDLVIQLAAPKGASRMVQRIGRANHRLDEPSRAILAPANRFEYLECRAAADAILGGHLDGEPARTGTLDTLAQHIMGCACSEPFALTDLYDEVRTSGPYADLSWEDFETVVDFVSTGGYALRTYDKFRRIVPGQDGLWRARNAQAVLAHRMNVGAIVSPAMINVRIGGGKRPMGGRKVGEAEEGFFEADEAGRHLHLRRPGLAVQQPGRGRRLRHPRARQGPDDAQLGRVEVPAVDLSGGPRAGDDARRARMARPAPGRPGMAGLPEGPLDHPRAGRDAAGDLPARQALPPGLLSVRGAPGPHHPGHAADPAAGPAGHRPAGLRGQRLRGQHLVAEADGRSWTWTSCSPRTCWATTWRPGWTRAS